MFEKEAEEWVKENMDCCKTDNSVNKSIPYFDEEERCCAKSAFQDGAEFGYNKANEWHYVKDGLPPIKKEYNCRSELVLVLSKEKEMQYAQYVEKEKTWARGIFEINFKPYAWKEIVLPEHPKEGE